MRTKDGWVLVPEEVCRLLDTEGVVRRVGDLVPGHQTVRVEQLPP